MTRNLFGAVALGAALFVASAGTVSQQGCTTPQQVAPTDVRLHADQALLIAEAGMDGVSTSTAITIAGLTKSEKEANEEFLDPGITAKKAKWKGAPVVRPRTRSARVPAMLIPLSASQRITAFTARAAAFGRS